MSTQESGNSQQAFPSLCKNGCGFFGRIENKGFCSVCYKENLKKVNTIIMQLQHDFLNNETESNPYSIGGSQLQLTSRYFRKR